MMLIGVMVCFKEAHRLWKPLRYIRSFGPIFCCIIGLCAEYIGHISKTGVKLVRVSPVSWAACGTAGELVGRQASCGIHNWLQGCGACS